MVLGLDSMCLFEEIHTWRLASLREDEDTVTLTVRLRVSAFEQKKLWKRARRELVEFCARFEGDERVAGDKDVSTQAIRATDMKALTALGREWYGAWGGGRGGCGRGEASATS